MRSLLSYEPKRYDFVVVKLLQMTVRCWSRKEVSILPILLNIILCIQECFFCCCNFSSGLSCSNLKEVFHV